MNEAIVVYFSPKLTTPLRDTLQSSLSVLAPDDRAPGPSFGEGVFKYGHSVFPVELFRAVLGGHDQDDSVARRADVQCSDYYRLALTHADVGA